MAEAPSGTVSLLFTDIEGSTKLLQRSGERYAELLADHRSLLRAAFDSHNGYEIDTEGDAFFVVFRSAKDAAAAAAAGQRALAEHSWPDGNEVRVRMGLHTGEPHLVDRAYVGLDVHRAARVMGAGHGGQVLLSQSTRNQLDDDLPLLDLGEHRLKDLLQPEHLFQLLIEGLPSEFPALKTLGNRPTNLPMQPNPLIGRDSEVRTVTELLRADDVRLLTLTGPGGTGKTRLALQVGAELLDLFRSGVFFVSLAPIVDEDLLIPSVAQVLAVREVPGEDIGETLRAYLTGKEMLLVLDNLEHIMGAVTSVAALLSSVPELRILVTSRERLHIAAEHVYEVPPLTLAESAHQDPAALLESGAIALFTARAQAASPSFDLTEENAADVFAICRQLEGLPLALELAAARVAVLSPQALLSRLGERLPLLTGGPRDAAQRHQTLRNTLEWSHDLLAELEQIVFCRLAVFVDGCRLDAAESVGRPPSGDVATLDVLQSLIDKSLLRQRSDPDGERRFWMLETVREYAGSRMQARGEAEMLARRHAEHFLELAEQAEPYLWAQQTQPWLQRLAVEQANFRAALERSLSAQDATFALRLAGALYPFWEIRGQHGEARAWLSRGLALNGVVSAEWRAKALIGAGRATAWEFDWPVAIELLEEAADLSRRLDDAEGVGRCLGFIGHARLFTGDSAGAAAVLNEGLDLARRTGDEGSVARALNNAAAAALEELDFDRAREMYEEVGRIARADDRKLNLAMSAIQLGYVDTLGAEYGRAANHLEDGVRLFAEIGETTWTPLAQRYIGLLALLTGKIEEAECVLRSSLRDGREQAPAWQLVYWVEGLAAVAAVNGESVRASTLWGATDGLWQRFRLAILEESRQLRERFKEEISRSNSHQEAWAEGHAMTLDQAIAYALTEDLTARSPTLR
jgi:predicted ATPase/class 3 adenylate cyclase